MTSNIENSTALNDVQCDKLQYGFGAVGSQANGVTAKAVAQYVASDAPIAFVAAQNDTRFIMPLTTTDRSVTINPCGAAHPVMIPARLDSYRRSRSKF